MKTNKELEAYQNNFKVLVEASHKVINGDFESIDNVHDWIMSHPNYIPTNYDLMYGISHLNVLKFYF